jgi:hypothetical protein
MLYLALHMRSLYAIIVQNILKSLKLEMWGRKWNLVLRDIPGKLDETPRVTEINVMLLTAVHRLAGGIDENKPSITSSKQYSFSGQIRSG